MRTPGTTTRSGRPPLIDPLGREWVWDSGDLYTHCGMAIPADWVPQQNRPIGEKTLDNPNYDPCDICLDGRKRNVTPCKPEWNCSHAVCARMHAANQRP